jgi:hypothetical protein
MVKVQNAYVGIWGDDESVGACGYITLADGTRYVGGYVMYDVAAYDMMRGSDARAAWHRREDSRIRRQAAMRVWDAYTRARLAA